MVRSEFKPKRIKSADYKSERIRHLQNLVIEGEDAEAVYKYAYKLRKEIEEEMLMTLKSNASDISGARIYYQVACRFCEMLEHAATVGKEKEKTLVQLRSQG